MIKANWTTPHFLHCIGSQRIIHRLPTLENFYSHYKQSGKNLVGGAQSSDIKQVLTFSEYNNMKEILNLRDANFIVQFNNRK